MHADYIANPLYGNNPFIEALPPMLSGKDLIRALAVIPPYSDSDRDRSTGERLQLLSSLYEFYQPLSMTIDLYCEVYTAMQHCYGQYSIQSEAAAMQNSYSMMHGNALAASIGGGNSFSVIGVSGLGKSTALQRVLSLYPQVMQLKKPSAEPVPGCLLALDSLLHDTLDSSFDYRDGSVYHAVLDCALRSRGWRSLTGGRTYATKIENALLNLYGSYVPATDISAKQLHATLCNKSVAPRYVLQLAVLLRLTLYDLLHAPDAVLDYKAEMKEMYQSGASMYHIAQLYGTDAKTVARWVKQ